MKLKKLLASCASALGATPLTEAGETLTSDVIKSFVPKVEVPKKKKEQ